MHKSGLNYHVTKTSVSKRDKRDVSVPILDIAVNPKLHVSACNDHNVNKNNERARFRAGGGSTSDKI